MPKQVDGILNDEGARLCQRALYVEPLTYPIETIQYPTNGHEHIYLARQEAQELFPDADFSECMPMFESIKMKTITSVDNKSEKSISIKQWKSKQARSFSSLALELKSNRKQLMKKFSQNEFPAVENEKDVHIFCLGTEFYKKIFNENVQHMDGHLPLLSIVLHLDQEEILTILRYMKRWVSQIGMNNSVCRWIYSLLACLHKPVSDECEEFLEGFHDKCIQDIKCCSEDEKNRFHLIAAILKTYFCVKSYQVGPSLDAFLKLC